MTERDNTRGIVTGRRKRWSCEAEENLRAVQVVGAGEGAPTGGGVRVLDVENGAVATSDDEEGLQAMRSVNTSARKRGEEKQDARQSQSSRRTSTRRGCSCEYGSLGRGRVPSCRTKTWPCRCERDRQYCAVKESEERREQEGARRGKRGREVNAPFGMEGEYGTEESSDETNETEEEEEDGRGRGKAGRKRREQSVRTSE
jgi:hypothetical protein